MSLWYCATCREAHGPEPGNTCPACFSQLSPYTVVGEHQASPAIGKSVDGRQSIGSATESISSTALAICQQSHERLRASGDLPHETNDADR